MHACLHTAPTISMHIIATLGPAASSRGLTATARPHRACLRSCTPSLAAHRPYSRHKHTQPGLPSACRCAARPARGQGGCARPRITASHATTTTNAREPPLRLLDCGVGAFGRIGPRPPLAPAKATALQPAPCRWCQPGAAARRPRLARSPQTRCWWSAAAGAASARCGTAWAGWLACLRSAGTT